MARVVVHLVGGSVLKLEIEADGPRKAVQRLLRERVLIGCLCADDAGELIGSEVLVPASRVHMVRWS